MLHKLSEKLLKLIDVTQDPIIAFLILIIPAITVGLAALMYARLLPSGKRRSGSIGVGLVFIIMSLLLSLWAFVPEMPLRKDALWVLQRIVDFISTQLGSLLFMILIIIGLLVVIKIATGKKPVELTRFEEKIKELTYVNSRLVEEKKELAQDNELLKKYLAERDDLIRSFNDTIAELKESIDLKDKDIQRLIAEANEKASEIVEYQRIVSTLENKIKQLELDVKLLTEQKAKLQEENNKLQKDISKLQSLEITINEHSFNAIKEIMPFLNNVIQLINRIDESHLNDKAKEILIDLLQDLGRIVGPIAQNYEHGTITPIEKIEVIGAIKVLNKIYRKINRLIE